MDKQAALKLLSLQPLGSGKAFYFPRGNKWQSAHI